METLRQMADRWRRDLYKGVLPFWMRHSLDATHGGYFTCLDHDGAVYDETKYAWLQGRQVYMLSRLYVEAPAGTVEDAQRHAWLRAAALGVTFLDRAREPDTSRLFFSTTRDGSARLHLQRKPYAAVFYVQGLLEFWRALQTYIANGDGNDLIDPALVARAPEFLAKARDMFEMLATWIEDPSLCGRPAIPDAARDAGATNLADVMCVASLALDFLKAGPLAVAPAHGGKGRDHYLGLIRRAMQNCERHYDTRRGTPGVLMEHCGSAGLSSATPAGRLFNPGHAIEVAWFLMQMCDVVEGGSPHHEKLALDVLEGSLRAGWDDNDKWGGGLMYMIDVEGKPLLDATVTATGKLWWPHTESLIALTMAYARTRDDKWLQWLKKVHDYSYRVFVDRAAPAAVAAATAAATKEASAGGGARQEEENTPGGWYGYCHRDGTLARTCKGGNYKGFFHVPRALFMSLQMADRMLAE